jgi:flagellar biosynthesis activator protein FlaF
MFQFSYADIIEDSPLEGRAREYEALTNAIALMQEADAEGLQSVKAATAIYKVRRLWSLLIEDMGRADCELPPQLRAQLISVGLWVFRELEDLRSGKAESFEGIIDITKILAEGLR